jgi:glycerol-3-phosphate dehydrogenase
VINATGVFTDRLMKMDDPRHESIISPSQGIHLVVDKEFLPGETAIMIPRTDDGRVLFAVPWHDKIVLGTTDTPISDITDEPIPQKEEIEFILAHLGRYLAKDPKHEDVKSMFAGLRPLVKGKTKRTAALSRDHLVSVSDSGLISITGGKWTTYRKMAEDVLDLLIEKNALKANACRTKELMMIDCYKDLRENAGSSFSEARYNQIEDIFKKEDNTVHEKIHPTLAITKGEILIAIRKEMCMTVEDALSRRSRALLLDAGSAIEAAPAVAGIMSKEMGKTDKWIKEEIDNFNEIAKNYLPTKK